MGNGKSFCSVQSLEQSPEDLPLHKPWKSFPSDSLLDFVRGYESTTKDVGCIQILLYTGCCESCRILSSVSPLDFVQTFRPARRDVGQLRILLHGPAGAGKSSFINSVAAILDGKINGRATVNTATGKRFTQNYISYKFLRNNGNFYPFVLTDSMGYENNNADVVEAGKLVLRGQIKDSTQFNPDGSLRMPVFRPNAALQDQVHVLVAVVAASSINSVNENIWKEMKKMRRAAAAMGIPELAILTKVDKCSGVRHDLSNINKSWCLKKKINQLSIKYGIPPNQISLVKNFSDEREVANPPKQLISSALKQMLLSGDNFLRYWTPAEL